MSETTIRFTSYPLTDPPPEFLDCLVTAFRNHEDSISTTAREKHLKSDEVLAILRGDLEALGFAVERGKKAGERIERPVFFGENGIPTLQYNVDAFHHEWRCGLEVEAIRSLQGGAVYRDLIQALVMVRVDYLCLAVPNLIVYGKDNKDRIYKKTCATAEALYGHNRIELPYGLIVIGY